MTSETLIPRVLWAQRHETVFLTFEVFEVKDEMVNIQADRVSFSGTRATDDAKFAVELELYAPVDPENSKVTVGHREVSLVLQKAEAGPYWPRLLKSTQKMHYIHTDFGKWKDEDEEDDEGDVDPGFGQFGGFNNNFAQFGGDSFGQGFDEDFEAEQEFEEAEAEEETKNEENVEEETQ